MADLFDLLERDRSIQDRFLAFHEANPDVMRRLVELARYAKSRGKRVGIRLLWERLRWEFAIEVDHDGEFKLNDHYHARYARLLAETYPDEFGGYFELRKLKAD